MNMIPWSIPPQYPDSVQWIALCSLPAERTGQTLVLACNAQSELWQIDLTTGQARQIGQLTIPDFNPDHPVQLIASSCGRMAAVSNRFGMYAAVIDLASGDIVLALERGEYHYDKSVYPLAFAVQNEQLLLIHGTDWNRLELTALLPEVKLLSERPIPTYLAESSSFEKHYLDYFHGQLHVSPDSTYIAETGWVWAPVGVTTVWSLPAWLENVWETEDGRSLDSVWQPLIDWDAPLVWLDHERLAVWAQIDQDLIDEEDWQEEGTQPALLIYNAAKSERETVLVDVPAFQTKSGIDHVYMYPQAQMAVTSDGRLFAWGRGLNMHCWNLADMQVEVCDASFQPDLYHAEADLFLKIENGHIQAWQCIRSEQI